MSQFIRLQLYLDYFHFIIFLLIKELKHICIYIFSNWFSFLR